MVKAPTWSLAKLNRRGEMLQTLLAVGYPIGRLQALPDAELEKLMAKLHEPGTPPKRSDPGKPPRTEP